MNDHIVQWFLNNEADVRKLAKDLFDNPELAEEEYQSARFLKTFMQVYGFDIQADCCELETAFIASWGGGEPKIGFLAEYDALPGLGQDPIPNRSPIEGNGHGCGHNLLGAGCAAAAAAIKYVMEEDNLAGTVLLYGCPAEETSVGKIVMAKAGCFDDLDIAISWHPSDKNRVSEDSFQAIVSRIFRFHGRTAHAAASPEQGRSALDAAELTNVAVNYLREHVTSDVSMHYIYNHAGDKPNVVPGFAELWYLIRAADSVRMRDADRRVGLAAEGAALATETRVESVELSASPETLINHSLARAMHDILEKAGPPPFTENEEAFAKELRKALGLPVSTKVVSRTVEPLKGYSVPTTGSTDVSQVSQLVPTVTLNTACKALGIPDHHWGVTACSGADLGFRGMVHAAKVMAQFALQLFKEADMIDEAWSEFKMID